MPGRDPPLLLEAADWALHLIPIPISVDVPIAVEVPILVGSARGFPVAHPAGPESRSFETVDGASGKPVMKVTISG